MTSTPQSPWSGLSLAPASLALEKTSSHSLSVTYPGPNLTQFTPQERGAGPMSPSWEQTHHKPPPKLLRGALGPWPVLWHLHTGFSGQSYCNTDRLGSPGPPPCQFPAPISLSWGPRAQTLQVSAVTSLPRLLHPGWHGFYPSLQVLSFSTCSVSTGLPDLAHLLVPFGNIWPQSCVPWEFLLTCFARDPHPSWGHQVCLILLPPLWLWRARVRQGGRKLRGGCWAPSLPPVLLLATLQTLSPRGWAASKAACKLFVEMWWERGGYQAQTFF